MVHGIIINEGPADWQIIQQKDGYADIYMSGTYAVFESAQVCRVFARIVSEENHQVIIDWKEGGIKPTNSFQGSWEISLESVPAGGLYRIETSLNQDNEFLEWSKRGDVIRHIGIGDVYVIAGQSNSAGYGKDLAYDPPELGVHLLRNSGRWDLAAHPFNDSTDTIHEANMEIANPGSCPYLSFGKFLKRELGYPIGFLQTALGGSAIRAWDPFADGVLYRNMLDIIKSQKHGIKGVLWYQGCSDANQDSLDVYHSRFKNLVDSLRSECGNELPFITVQLNRCINAANKQEDICWGRIRDIQRKAANELENVFIVPTSDHSLSDSIHNSSLANIQLGERLAKCALGYIYGSGEKRKAPDISGAEQTGDREIGLCFCNVYGRLDLKDAPAECIAFEVEDEQGINRITEYEIRYKKVIVLTLERQVKGKAYVHGAYQKDPKGMIPVDTATYLPMLSFYGIEIEKKDE